MRCDLFMDMKKKIREWLNTHREDKEIRKLFTRMKRNFYSIKRDIETG